MGKPAAVEGILSKSPPWRRVLPLAGVVLLVWILAGLDHGALFGALAQLSASTICLSALPFSFNLLCKAVRWWRLLLAQGHRLPFRVALAAYLAAQFYGQVTVGRLGELYRAEALIERGVPAGRALSSCVLDRVFDLLLVLSLGSVLGAFVAGHQRAAWAAVIVIATASVAVAGAAFLQRARCFTRGTARASAWIRVWGLERFPWTAKVRALFRDLAAGAHSILRPGPLLEASLWTVTAWTGYFGTLWVLADGLALGVSKALLTASASLAALSALLPVTVSGLGARELIYQQALGTAGVSPEAAVVTALMHLAIMSAVAICLGWLGLLVRRRQRGSW